MKTDHFHPKVSIVIPVYNGSNYLKEAIGSALAQTYKNVEIIVVNDGSNDNGATEKIAKSYGNKIKYYKKENGGVATALNLGIEKMTGEYFSWLSHDDLYYPDKIEKQINYLRKLDDRNVFLYSNYSILRDGETIPVIHDHEILRRKNRYSLLRGCVNGITVLIAKNIFDEIGKFDANLRCTQDYDCWRRIEKKFKFIHMEDVLSITRLHSAQDSVASPSAITEGNDLWIDMVKKLPAKEKIELEGTIFNFYLEMVKFLESTPYKDALVYCKREMIIAEKELNSNIFYPKVSIIVPFYNRIDKTLNALKSAINQSYKNIEVLLINDCSTDDISQLSKLVKGNNNIKVYSTKVNGGPAAARNVGIKMATGEYIAFLDSDDEFMPDKLKKQIHAMSRYNLDFSYTSYKRRENGRDTIVSDPDLKGIVVPRIISGCTIATPTVVLRKSILIKNSITFNEQLKIGEDTCFWLDIAKYCEFLLLDEPLTVVNVDDNTHANDFRKLIQGIQNIIAYLFNDEYYSRFNFELSLLCEYLYSINIDAKYIDELRILHGAFPGKFDIVATKVFEGRVITSPKGGIFLVEKGFKRPFPNEGILNSHAFRPSDVVTISDSELNLIPDGAPMAYNFDFIDGRQRGYSKDSKSGFIKKTLPYRAARVLYRKGPRVALKVAKNKIREK